MARDSSQAAAKPKRRRPKVVRVNARLFADDVKQIKGWAAEDLRFWHAELRELVHAAVQRRMKGDPKIR